MASATSSRPPSPRERRVAALVVERFGPVSTLGLEHVHWEPIPVRPVVIDDSPSQVYRRQRDLLDATDDRRRAASAARARTNEERS